MYHVHTYYKKEINHMVLPMSFYECVFIARQDISGQDVQKLTEKFDDIFKSFGGELMKREYWGLRQLAYVVKKNKKGHYMMMGVRAPADAIKEFERNCKINEDIIKFLTLRVKSIDEKPSIMMQAPAKAMPGIAMDDLTQ
jgi:small subunit ribosomal protein S6